MIEAIIEYHKHKVAFEEFSATFDKALLTEWEEMIKKWDADQKQPDPYAEVNESEKSTSFRRTAY